jgi:phosphoribosylglycinamide formyltransferase 1
MSHYPLRAELTTSLISPTLPDSVTNVITTPMRLGVLASGNGSNFEAIAQAIADQILNASLQVVIYNNPDAKVVQRADRWQVPSVLLNHRQFPSREVLDAEIVRALQQADVNWVIMAGWMRVVTPVLINAFPGRILNIHPSLLPSFPGIRAIEQALAAGVKITGCTVHQVIPEVDRGSILIQAAVPIFPDDTPETLHERIQIQEHKILPTGIEIAASLEYVDR